MLVVLAPVNALGPVAANVTVAVLAVWLLTWSTICTVTAGLMGAPAVVFGGRWPKARWLAAAALTATVLLMPVIELVTVSVAMTVWLPAVSRVTLKVPVPLTRVELGGRTAWPSLLVKRTVPL